MLSRTADHLYWMARYTERAESLARMLEVNYRLSLLPQERQVIEQGWTATLTITGMLEAFRQHYPVVTPSDAITFMALDRDNTASIYACLCAARDNARAVRGALTSEIWESLNSTWLELRATSVLPASHAEVADFFEWVKFRSHLVRGAIQGTLLRDEAFHFTRLGTSLERADNTARILDVKYHMLLPRGEGAGGAVDYYQWSALLHSVSAFEIYRKVYRDLITPWRVAELLILREDLPRSLHRCMSELYSNLQAVTSGQSAETERRAGQIHASLRFGRIDDVFRVGLHEYLVQFLGQIRELGERIARDFLVPTSA